MKSNLKPKMQMTTNEVGTSVRVIDAEKQLVRMTLATMLFEGQFYTDGVNIADKLTELAQKVNPDKVMALAEKARTDFKLRHTPLHLAVALARVGKLTANGLNAIIQRADELGEFLSLYWAGKKTPISNQVKKGLAMALGKFNEYQLAKYDFNSASVKIRDVLFLTHAKPINQSQEELFKRIASDTLEVPMTWETELSAGADKAETFMRLMNENKLGALAFLRNLRNMVQAGISESEIRAYGKNVNVDKVLPFRYIAAARVMPQFEDMLEEMMLRSLAVAPKLPGRTVLVVDTSGSMMGNISQKSDLTRIDAACALAMLAREICEDVVIYATAGNDHARKHATMLIPPRRGFALADYIRGVEVRQKLGGGGIFTIQAMDWIASQEQNNQIDRVIIFTDEQDTDYRSNPGDARVLAKDKSYILNVFSYENGINSGKWQTITGFSEAVIEYIRLSEQL